MANMSHILRKLSPNIGRSCLILYIQSDMLTPENTFNAIIVVTSFALGWLE